MLFEGGWQSVVTVQSRFSIVLCFASAHLLLAIIAEPRVTHFRHVDIRDAASNRTIRVFAITVRSTIAAENAGDFLGTTEQRGSHPDMTTQDRTYIRHADLYHKAVNFFLEQPFEIASKLMRGVFQLICPSVRQ